MAHPAHHFHRDGVELPFTVAAEIGGPGELRVGPPVRGERDQARRRLIDADAVIHAIVMRSDVRQAKADVLELLLDGEVVLVDLAVARVNRIPRDRLGGHARAGE